jgi:hypothetical protein
MSCFMVGNRDTGGTRPEIVTGLIADNGVVKRGQCYCAEQLSGDKERCQA